MKLLGEWMSPIDPYDNKDLCSIALKSSGYRCQFCGVKSLPSEQYDFGMFNFCPLNDKTGDGHDVAVLCNFCECLNSFDRLKGKGVFVKCPSLTQSEFTHAQIVIFCAQVSEDRSILSMPLYQKSNAILGGMHHTPESWGEIEFNGSVETVKRLIESYDGFTSEDVVNREIDSLRFMYDPEAFTKSIEHLCPYIESLVHEWVSSE